MATSVTLNPAVTNVTVASPSAISVDLTTSTTTVNVTSGLLPQNLGTSDSPTFAGLTVTSGLLPQNLSTSDSPTFAGLTVNAITASQTISIVTDTSIDVTEFATYNGKKIIYTGGAGTIILADAVAADIGKSWTIINAGTGAITIDRTTSTQTIKLLNGSSVSGGTTNLTVATGGVIEVICTAADNYITFGSGVS